jgi:anthranilate phosphoribosyltransferase
MHPAMKAVAPVRKELGFRTIFNLLGPLTNPARATVQVIGVFGGQYTELIARTATLLGVSAIATVYNSVGLDELAPLGQNRVSTIEDGALITRTFSATEVGLKECSLSDLSGGDASVNAGITRHILNGGNGAASDTVCLNAGLAFVTAGEVKTVTEGIELARDTIADGSAMHRLDEFVEKTRSV